MTATFLEATPLTFGTIPNGSQSTPQEVEVVDSRQSAFTVDSDHMFFGGLIVKLTATPGTLTVRAFDGDPALGSLEVYRSTMLYSAAPEVLSDRLGGDMLPMYDSTYITLEGSVGGMTADVKTYIIQGPMKTQN